MGRGPQEQVSKAGVGREQAGDYDGAPLRHRLEPGRCEDDGRRPDSMASMTSETRHVLWLESAGVLAIETTHGGALGGQPLTTKTLYKKN